MDSNDFPTRHTFLELHLCTATHCIRRVVKLKVRTADLSTQELNGPDLSQAIRDLVNERGLAWVRVRETSCMKGCTIGPRLNVVGPGGLRDAVRYLHLPAAKSSLHCARWEEVVSLEALLERHLQTPEKQERERNRHPRDSDPLLLSSME